MIEEKYQYFAFISYKREDEEWAKWLQHRLEHYKLPSNLNGRMDLPKEIRPVFKDTSELMPGNLPEQIHQALDLSKYLIVICSPRSAKSEWVNKEIETFISRGRTTNVIPFIIDGKAFSGNPEEECFPLALRQLPKEKEILGANINEMGRDAAAVKVVARMFDVRFDELWQRHEREQRRRRNIIIASVATFVLGVLGVAAWIWHQNVELSEKNVLINQQNRALDAKTDSLRFANDSIQAQQNALQIAYNDLARSQHDLAVSNENLVVANYRIAEERDNVLKANHEMQINQSKFLAEKASALVDEGDSYLARLLALQALPPNRPYTIEAERALRKAVSLHSAVLDGRQETVVAAEYSKDGCYIASISHENVAIMWDAVTGKQLWKFEHERGVYAPRHSIAFSPDGKYVAVPYRGGLFLLDTKTGERMRVFYASNKNSKISSVAFSHNGRYLVSGSEDKLVRLWDMRSGKEIVNLKGHKKGVSDVAFSPNGQLAASASIDNNTVKIWNVSKKKEKFTIKGHSVSFSPDGCSLATASNNEVITWDVNTGKELRSFAGHHATVMNAKYSPDGSKIVSVSRDSTIIIWDVKSGRKIHSFSHRALFYYATFSPDGQYVVSASNDKTLRIWDVGTTRNHWFLGKNLHYTYAHFTPDSKSVVISSWEDGQDINLVVDLSTGDKKKEPFKAEDEEPLKAENEKQFVIPVDSSEIDNSMTYVFSKDGSQFAYFNWDKIILWYKNTKRWSAPVNTKEGYVFSMTFSPDNQYLLASPDDGSIRIWCVKTGEEITHFDFPRIVDNLTYSPDGCMLAFTVEKALKIWDSKTFRELFVFEEEDDDRINSIIFSPDSKRIISISSSGSVRVWPIKPLQDLIDETRDRFKNRPLTPEERRKYYLE